MAELVVLRPSFTLGSALVISLLTGASRLLWSLRSDGQSRDHRGEL